MLVLFFRIISAPIIGHQLILSLYASRARSIFRKRIVIICGKAQEEVISGVTSAALRLNVWRKQARLPADCDGKCGRVMAGWCEKTAMSMWMATIWACRKPRVCITGPNAFYGGFFPVGCKREGLAAAQNCTDIHEVGRSSFQTTLLRTKCRAALAGIARTCLFLKRRTIWFPWAIRYHKHY